MFKQYADRLNFLQQQVAELAGLARQAGEETLPRQWLQQAAEWNSECYHIAIVGNMKRGKSTLLNALLGRQDDAISPVRTKVCTSSLIRYLDNTPAPEEFALVHFAGRPEPQRLELTELKEYITEENNPDNRKQVRKVEVFGHFPLLNGKAALIDTPGRGSINLYHETLLEEFLPLADAVILLFSADLPVEQSEYLFLQTLAELNPEKLFYVVTKWDELDNERDRDDVRHFIRQEIARAGLPAGTLFECSAKTVFDALKLHCDDLEPLRRQSGVAALEQALESFLLSCSARGVTAGRRRQKLIDSMRHYCAGREQYLRQLLRQDELDRTALQAKQLELRQNRETFRNDFEHSLQEFERRWQREIVHFERNVLRRTERISDLCIDHFRRGGLLPTVLTSFRLKKKIEKQVTAELDALALELTERLDAAVNALSAEYRDQLDLYLGRHHGGGDPVGQAAALSAVALTAGSGILSWNSVSGALATLSGSYQTFLALSGSAAQAATANSVANLGLVGAAKGLLFGSETAVAAASTANAAAGAQLALVSSAVATLGTVAAAAVAVWLAEKFSCFGLKAIQQNRIPELVEHSLREALHRLQTTLDDWRRELLDQARLDHEALLTRLQNELEQLSHTATAGQVEAWQRELVRLQQFDAAFANAEVL